jgi:hypothetical protein
VTDQFSLFVEDTDDALRAAIKALGGAKQVGTLLRPELPADAAGRWLNDTLNDAKREKLDFKQGVLILKLAREKGFHTGFEFVARECGYAATPTEPDTERAALMREFNVRVRELSTIVQRVERIGA